MSFYSISPSQVLFRSEKKHEFIQIYSYRTDKYWYASFNFEPARIPHHIPFQEHQISVENDLIDEIRELEKEERAKGVSSVFQTCLIFDRIFLLILYSHEMRGVIDSTTPEIAKKGEFLWVIAILEKNGLIGFLGSERYGADRYLQSSIRAADMSKTAARIPDCPTTERPHTGISIDTGLTLRIS